MSILQNYYTLIETLTRKRWLWVLLSVLILLLNALVFPLFTSGETRSLPDTRFYYTSGTLTQYLYTMNRDQKTTFIIFHTTVDILYPVTYTLFLSFLLFAAGGTYRKLIVPLPLSIFIFDILENSGMVLPLSLLRSGTFMARADLQVTPFFTTAKWICTGITAGIVCITAVRHFLHK